MGYIVQEGSLLIRLKGRAFICTFSDRTTGSLQVRYCNELSHGTNRIVYYSNYMGVILPSINLTKSLVLRRLMLSFCPPISPAPS